MKKTSFDGKIREYETPGQRDPESGRRIFQNGRQESAPAHREISGEIIDLEAH